MNVGEVTGLARRRAPGRRRGQGRLARAELAADQHDVAGRELGREACAERLGLGGAAGAFRLPVRRRGRAGRASGAAATARGISATVSASSAVSSRRLRSSRSRSAAKSSRSVSTQRRRAQRRRRVEQRHHEHRRAAERVDLRRAADLGDPGLALPVISFVAKLPSVAITVGWISSIWRSQVGPAGLDLDRLRVAVAGGPAFQDVRDEDVLAAQLDPLEQLVEQRRRRGRRTGRPWRSSSAPGASPTNIRSASALPAPKTTLVRVSASGQRVQSDASR